MHGRTISTGIELQEKRKIRKRYSKAAQNNPSTATPSPLKKKVCITYRLKTFKP